MVERYREFEGKWPDDKPFAVWLSHDVDRTRKRLFHALLYFLKEKRIYHLRSIFQEKEPYWNFDTIMEIEERFGVRSTFFFLNESMRFNPFWPREWKLSLGRYRIDEPKIVEKMRQLAEGGWEIGVHGSYDSYLDRDLLQSEKDTLESITGRGSPGIRQHYLNLEIPGTWVKQRDAGFKYDASFGLRNDVGYRDDIYRPFFPLDDSRDRDFTVFPLAIMDGYLMDRSKRPGKENGKGGETTGVIEEACATAMKVIDSAEENGGLLSILWHNKVFNGDEFPGYRTVYEKILEECKKRGAWFGTGDEIYSWVNRVHG